MNVLAPEVPFPRAMGRFPTLRQSLLGAFDLCALETVMDQEHAWIGGLDDPDRLQWHTHPQARGQILHRWAGRVLLLLEQLDQDQLTDDVQCPNCGLRPNDRSELIPGQVEFAEGNDCPACATMLMRKPLTEEALDLLCDTLRQADIPDEDVVRVPQEHVKDLEWTVVKFAREQRFKIANLVSVEERLHATLSYPNPYGGTVERVLTGALDAVFAEAMEDGVGLHVNVIDWKDTWAIPGALSISTEGYWQQRFYAWLIMKNNPAVMKVTLREVYVRFKAGDSGEDNHRKATITREKLPLIERQLAVVAEGFDRAWEAFEEEREVRAEWDSTDEAREQLTERMAVVSRRARALLLPSPGGHCNYCPKPHLCPIADDVRVSGSVRTPEDAERVAGELVVVKRMVKHRELAIKGYLEHPDTARSARARKPIAEPDGSTKLPVYKDHRPGLPEGVPVKHAKGNKVFTMVEGKRSSGPSREQVEEALAESAKGRKVDAESLYRTGSSSTLRLVEEAVPTDEALESNMQVESALAESVARLERMRAAG